MRWIRYMLRGIFSGVRRGEFVRSLRAPLYEAMRDQSVFEDRTREAKEQGMRIEDPQTLQRAQQDVEQIRDAIRNPEKFT